MRYEWIVPGRPAIILAPMEGVTDAPMRTLLTERGGFSFCVSEFLRVGQVPYPDYVLLDHIPELKNGCQTPSGTPIQVQLLGGDEKMMARTAVQAVRLGAKAIDLNFGCPSKTVNRHDGGAALLQHPLRIKSIISAVREAVDSSIPVSAKMRLGWENMEDIYHNAEQASEAGASWLTIHARTKKQGYAPPAYWSYIGEVRKRIGIPVVGNGEIWSVADFIQCRLQTGCNHFMIGRGALADPSLPLSIAKLLEIDVTEFEIRSRFTQDATHWEPLLRRFSELSLPVMKKGPDVVVGRMKQWLKFAHLRESISWFDDVKRSRTIDELFSVLDCNKTISTEMRN
jgi:tRNA-dihydrouridine synthase C